jgi:hypothetical protein
MLAAFSLVVPAVLARRPLDDPAAALDPSDSNDHRPLTKLKELEPIFSDPTEIERLINETKELQQKPFPASSCEYLKGGSRLTDWAADIYTGPKSNIPTIINVGSYKTGSTSVEAAARQLGVKSCKIGWGDCGYGGGVAFEGSAAAAYRACPIWDDTNSHCGHGIDIIRNAAVNCQMLGDAPWPFAWPTAMRAYPRARIILTRQKTCADWLYHVKGLWNAGSGRGGLTTCWFEADSPTGWHNRCVETERAIVLTAQKLKLRLLVVHATGRHSTGNMQRLAQFLGRHVSAHAKYPHVSTPSKHLPGEVPPPEDAPDPNEDLWGSWNGGVPTGSISQSPPQISNVTMKWLAHMTSLK